MRKILVSLALFLSSVSVMAVDGKLHVKGDLKGIAGDTLLIHTGKQSLDTAFIKNGKFEFDVILSKVQQIAIITPATLRGEDFTQLVLPGVPGESMELVGDITKRYDIGGSTFYQQYHEADVATEPASVAMAEFNNAIMARIQNGESEEKLGEEYNAKAPALQQKYVDAINNFIKQHPNYEACAAIIPMLDDVELMETAAGYLSESVRNGRCRSLFQDKIDGIKAQAAQEAASVKAQATGVEAPDFTLNDINGKPLSLSSLRGKYVLLDFWGSWCGWCIKGIPQLKEYYDKYKGKFEILSIACNDTDEKWKAAVKKYEMPWLHVINPKNSNALEGYMITGFPTKILIGPDGKIIKTVVGEDPSFYTIFDETFGK